MTFKQIIKVRKKRQLQRYLPKYVKKKHFFKKKKSPTRKFLKVKKKYLYRKRSKLPMLYRRYRQKKIKKFKIKKLKLKNLVLKIKKLKNDKLKNKRFKLKLQFRIKRARKRLVKKLWHRLNKNLKYTKQKKIIQKS